MQPPPDPRELITKKLMRDDSQAHLADQLKVTRQALNMVLNGHREISAGLAVKLGSLSGDGAEYWLRLQRDWNVWRSSPAGEVYEQSKEQSALLDHWNARGSRILVDSDILEALEVGWIKISAFRSENLKKASYDLTIDAPRYMDGDTTQSLNEDKKAQCYWLPPNELFCARTNETIGLSDQIIARLGPTTDLIDTGIVAYLGLQIDPGYQGEIFFTLENRRKKRVPLGRNEPCISLEFHFTARQPKQTLSEHAGSAKGGAFSQFQEPGRNSRSNSN